MSLRFRNGKQTSHIGQLIETATNGSRCSSENWAAFMDICDAINVSEEGPKEAAKAIRKRFQCKESASALLTLKLLETCVKNCGKRFHIHIATKEFMQEMIKLISPKYNPSVELQNTVLSLIQTWAYAFQSSPELREVSKHYQELKTKGVEFPVLDPDLASQTFIPEKSASPVAATDVAVHRGTRSGTAMSPTSQYALQRSLSSPPVSMYQPNVVSGPDRVAKLRSELGTVQQNCRVFGEILTELSSGAGNPDDIELLEDLNSTCRQMQKRIVELLETCEIEQVTEDLLTVNDELNNVFLRYDRYQRMRAGRVATQPDHTPTVCPVQPPMYTPEPASPTHIVLPPVYSPRAQEAEHGAAGDNAVSAGGASGSDNVAVGQLIDFGADTPSPGPTAAMANLSLNSGAGFNANATQNAAKYSAAEPFKLTDRETDLAEMEEWLKANPMESTADPRGAGESVTSAEFDRFLSERVRDAERMPDISSGSTPGQRPDVGPTSQPQTGGELFSL